MALIVITISDNKDEVSVGVLCEPAIDFANPADGAQSAAVQMLNALPQPSAQAPSEI